MLAFKLTLYWKSLKSLCSEGESSCFLYYLENGIQGNTKITKATLARYSLTRSVFCTGSAETNLAEHDPLPCMPGLFISGIQI
jgi:hypothetical protein